MASPSWHPHPKSALLLLPGNQDPKSAQLPLPGNPDPKSILLPLPGNSDPKSTLLPLPINPDPKSTRLPLLGNPDPKSARLPLPLIRSFQAAGTFGIMRHRERCPWIMVPAFPTWELSRDSCEGCGGEELAERHARGALGVRVTGAQQPCRGEEGAAAGMGSIPALPWNPERCPSPEPGPAISPELHQPTAPASGFTFPSASRRKTLWNSPRCSSGPGKVCGFMGCWLFFCLFFSFFGLGFSPLSLFHKTPWIPFQ